MADLDVVTLAEVKSRLGGSVTRNTDDVDIQADITALSAMFDDRFGAVIIREIADEEVHPNRSCDDWSNYWPVLTTPAPTADVGDVEIIDRGFGMLHFTDPTATTIDYSAGRFANTETVSELFKAAFLITLRNWRQAGHVAPHLPPGADFPTPRTAFPTFALPNASAQALAKYQRRHVIA